MKCSRCGKERGNLIICPFCGLSSSAAPSFFHKKNSWPFVINIVALSILLVGGGWSVALAKNEALGFLFFFFPLVPVYFLLLWALVSLPLWWLPSVFIAWLLERSDRVRHVRRDIVIVNVWTVIAAGVFVALASVIKIDLFGNDPIFHLTGGQMGIHNVMDGVRFFGCLLVPIFWSAVTVVLAVKRKRQLVFALVAGLLAVIINLLGTVLYPMHQADIKDQEKVAEQQKEVAEITKGQHQAQVRLEQKRKQAELERQQLLAKLTFTPYSVDTSGGNSVKSITAELNPDYQSPSLVVDAIIGQGSAERKVRFTQMPTSTASPVQNGSCYPAPVLSNYPKSKEEYACEFSFTTSKGVRVYKKVDVDKDNYMDRHLFVINDVFVIFQITTYTITTYDPPPSAVMPLSKLIDSLVPVSRDVIPKK